MYHCPNCGKEIGFGESICPNCKSDVTNVWEQTPKKDNRPKVVPGMGGMDSNSDNPVPPASDSPFPPPSTNSPFPSAQQNADSPFPPMKSENKNEISTDDPFSGEQQAQNPFASPTQQDTTPESGNVNKAFPPEAEDIAPKKEKSNYYLDIPKIGGKLFLQNGETRIGRDEIQGIASKALPDLNAYKNISRKRANSEHFSIKIQENKIILEDRGSTNGTYLGTEKITGSGPRDILVGHKFVLPIEEHGKMVQLEIFLKKQ